MLALSVASAVRPSCEAEISSSEVPAKLPDEVLVERQSLTRVPENGRVDAGAEEELTYCAGTRVLTQ